MYGNYCGPYWSDGKWQTSVVGSVDPIDELDAACQRHDAQYALGTDRRQADLTFAAETIGTGTLASIFGVMVGVQGLLRPSDKFNVRNLSPMKSNNNNRKRTPSMRPRVVTQPQRSRGDDSIAIAPRAIATRRTGTAPRTRMRKDGVVEITHRSFLQSVVSSGPFGVQAIQVNPGITGAFPWLSKLARKYEQYRLKKLRYEFRSVCSTSTPGVEMMSFDYDAADALPPSKAIQAQSVPNSESNVWMNNDLVVQPPSEWKYVRSGGLASNLDIKTYDIGQLVLSTVYGDGTVVGELYVEYTVELKQPTDGPEIGGTMTFNTNSVAIPFHSNNSFSGEVIPFSRVDDTHLVATQTGEFLLVFRWEGTGLSGTITPVLTGANLESVITSLSAAGQSTRAIAPFRIRMATGDILTLGNLGTATTVTSLKVFIGPAPYANMLV